MDWYLNLDLFKEIAKHRLGDCCLGNYRLGDWCLSDYCLGDYRLTFLLVEFCVMICSAKCDAIFYYYLLFYFFFNTLLWTSKGKYFVFFCVFVLFFNLFDLGTLLMFLPSFSFRYCLLGRLGLLLDMDFSLE